MGFSRQGSSSQKGGLERNRCDTMPCRSFFPRKGPRQDKKFLSNSGAVQHHMAPGWPRPGKFPKVSLLS